MVLEKKYLKLHLSYGLGNFERIFKYDYYITCNVNRKLNWHDNNSNNNDNNNDNDNDNDTDTDNNNKNKIPTYLEKKAC